MLARTALVARTHIVLAAVLVAGTIARAIALPITHGQDFTVWDLASSATLDRVNVYQHHPGYPGGPFAYFPLFIYLELPFQWLSQHGTGSFMVLGKLPMVAADIACALLIYAALQRITRPRWIAALGAAAFFLNPLVIYDSAYYGRFDTLGCALLLAAVLGLTGAAAPSRHSAWWFALAVAAKTFPGFVLAGVLRRSSGLRVRTVVILVGVLVALCVPYLGTPHALYTDIVHYDAVKPPTGLTWQYLLPGHIGHDAAQHVSYVLLLVFAASTVMLAVRIADLWLYTGVVLVAFLLASKLVLEQYLIWPMPFLLVVGLGGLARTAGRDLCSWASLALVAMFSIIGMVDNENYFPLGRSSWLSVVVGALSLAYVALAVIEADRISRARMPGSWLSES